MQILLYPHQDLFKKAELLEKNQVTNLEEKIRQIFNLTYAYGGVGLAAPQVGWLVRLCVINPRPPKRKSELVLINPEIIDRDGNTFRSHEGCLSLPGTHSFVKRYPKVSVKYYDQNFECHTAWFDDKNIARIIQHEIDHLDGICAVFPKK